jgi:undecaprenyl diphosphate synthase
MPNSQSAPRHIAIIMDGNGRWAKRRGLLNINGHKAGVERIRDMLDICRDNSVEALTLFAFSSENWQRPKREVDALMNLFHTYLQKESPRMREESIRLRVIGGRTRFNDKILAAIEQAETLTQNGNRHLVIAADYGGKWDIAMACRAIAARVQRGELSIDEIDECELDKSVALADLPQLDLLIRTGGEVRISNFLLWQSAYAELYFSDKLWPDFTQQDLQASIDEFRRRQRRFGLTVDQIQGQGGA